ncbi:hypothetical protein [Streptomyces sp. NEAU-S77]|uniref:hypothetical protein n=1 Tax=Streptomyces sp. NEAU-S77 TaxID=3411033 RepID=UPI003B9F8B54
MTPPLTHHTTTHTAPDHQGPEDLDRQRAAIAALGHELRAPWSRPPSAPPPNRQPCTRRQTASAAWPGS